MGDRAESPHHDWHFAVTPAGGGSPPATPAGLVAESTGPTSVSLTWQLVPDTDSYVIYRNGEQIGTTALPPGSPFLAAESSNDYSGWFNTNGATTQLARSAGQQMEGTLNVAEAFGSPPAQLYLCSLAYQTADGGILGAQAPEKITDNGDVDPGELHMIPLEALRDEDSNGIYDRLETGAGFRITSFQRNRATFSLTWNAFPGRTYQVQGSATMAPDSWGGLATVPVGPADLSCSANIPIDLQAGPVMFFRVRLIE